MERLTKKNKCRLSPGEEIVICKHSKNDCNDSCMRIIPCKWYKKAIEKLKRYEDLEEQGRLIKIPLEAYCIVDFEVRKGFVLEETYHMSRKPLLVVRYDDNTLKSHSGYLGISVFLTKSEAEAKLKELRGSNE
jgi:hypothetical protein